VKKRGGERGRGEREFIKSYGCWGPALTVYAAYNIREEAGGGKKLSVRNTNEALVTNGGRGLMKGGLKGVRTEREDGKRGDGN